MREFSHKKDSENFLNLPTNFKFLTNFFKKVFLSLLGDRWWFVLTPNSIQIYKDESEQDRKLLIPTEKLKLTEMKKFDFKLFHSEGKIIYRVSKIFHKGFFLNFLFKFLTNF